MSSFFSRGLCIAALTLIVTGAFAQTAMQKPAAPPVAAASATEWVNAEITKLDAARSRITLKHERIPSITMDAMAMPFKVKDKSLLDGRKVGEKVQFAVRIDDGDLFITQMRSVP